jgi:hypothetical protein
MTQKTHHILRLGLLLGVGLVLASFIVVGTMPSTSVQADKAAEDATGNPAQMNNAECLACHSQPGMTSTIGGTGVSITVDPELYGGSVHGIMAWPVRHAISILVNSRIPKLKLHLTGST